MVILCVTVSLAEMVTYLPISSSFIRFADRYADDAFGFAAGWNFFVFEAILVFFEMTACNVVIHFWSDAVPAGAIIAIVLVSYAFINMMAVKWYGEVEFWAAIGKVLLIIGLIVYTFVTMLGQLSQGQTNMRGPLLTLNRWQSTRGSIRFSLLEQSRLLQHPLF